MNHYEYRIYILLQGEVRQLIATVYTAAAAGEVVKVLCGVDKPHYTQVEIEIAPMTP